MGLSGESHDLFLQSVALFDSRVAATPSDGWGQPSPCEGWTARDVVSHVVMNLRALQAALDGADFFAVFGQTVEGDVVEAWDEQASRAPALIGEASESDSVSVGGNLAPVSMIVDGLMRDLVIHTWDLARAVGGDERLPDPMVVAATDAMAMVGPDARGPGLYGFEVPAPPGADAQTRLLALSGRRTQ